MDKTEPLALPESIRTTGKGLRPVVRTVTEAIRLMDRELPSELRSLPRWTFARALLLHAEGSRKKRLRLRRGNSRRRTVRDVKPAH
jgi:hypothetical protein